MAAAKKKATKTSKRSETGSASEMDDIITRTQAHLANEAKIAHENRKNIIKEAAMVRALDLMAKGEVAKVQEIMNFLEN